jgi:hypothetical protein
VSGWYDMVVILVLGGMTRHRVFQLTSLFSTALHLVYEFAPPNSSLQRTGKSVTSFAMRKSCAAFGCSWTL